MFNGQKDQLFTLIQSLTKSEKRHFKLYVNRLQSASNSKFLQLFEVIDKYPDYNEQQLLEKLEGTEKKQLANLKRHLYKQILTSLRLTHINKRIDIQIREQIDFARILYGKGMYMQSLRILERIKKIAEEHHQDILHLEILEFQKMIETRHITRSRQAGKMKGLLESAHRRSFVTYAASLFSNLNIQMHGWYIENGHALNPEVALEVKKFYDKAKPDNIPPDRMTFHEKINLYQANMWLHYILLDFKKSKEYALQWLNQFEMEANLKGKDPDLYMRGIYYLLTLLYLEGNKADYLHYLKTFEVFVTNQEDIFNENSQMIAFVYLYLSKLNYHLLQRDYQTAAQLEETIYEKINHFKDLLDPHRALLFYYKLAYCQFGLGAHEKCLLVLNRIVHLSDNFLRSDLLYAARILQIVCHLELGSYDIASHLIQSCQRSFTRLKDVSPLQRQLLRFLAQLSKTPELDHPEFFQTFLSENLDLIHSREERRNVCFFDLVEWIHKHLPAGDLSSKDILKNSKIVQLPQNSSR